MKRFIAGGTRGKSTGQTQWAPTRTAHDPNPPIPLESPPLAADEGMPTNSAMSMDVCVEGLAQPVEYYATDDIQGTQCAPLHDFALPPDESVLNTSIPDYLVDELYEPGEPWHQTGPPTTWMDATCTIPAIRQVAITLVDPANTTHNITLPSRMVAGNLCVVIFSPGSNVSAHAFTVPAGWWRTAATSTNQAQGYAIWRFLDGTEGTTLTLTTTATTLSYSHAFEIEGADPFTGVGSGPVATGTTNSGLDPASYTAWGGAAFNTLFIEVLRSNEEETATLGYPSNATIWRDQKATATGGNAGTAVGIAFSSSSTGVFDSGIWGTQWTLGNQYKALQFAIRGFCANDANAEPPPPYFPDSIEPEAVFDESPEWVKTPQQQLEDDDDPAHTSLPDYLEPDDDVDTYGWQQSVTIEDIPLNQDIPLTSIPTDLEPEAEVDSDGWQHPASDDGPVCTFPAVVSITAGSNLTTGTSHVITLPTLSVGDLAVVVFGDNGNTHTATAGWTEEVDNESVSVYSRVIDGSEGASMTITSSASTESVWYVYRIAAGSFDPLQTIFKSTVLNSATQDPPNVVFGWTDKTLVLAAMAGDTATSPITFTSGPSNLTAGLVGQETGGIALPDAYLAVAWGYVDASSFNPNAFSITPQSSNYDLATIAIRGACPLDLTTPGGHEFPADLEPEAEPDTNGWQSEPLHDFPDNADINNRAVPDELEPEAEVDTNGWFSAPLHDTPSTDDITETAVPVELLPDDLVDCDGWAFRLPDMEAAPPVVETRDPGVSVGTLPGVRPRRKWWVENISAEEKKRKKIHGTRWPDLPDVDVPKKFNPRVVTDKTVRPRLDAAQRDWKNKIRKARRADDEIIMAIIAVLLAEDRDD